MADHLTWGSIPLALWALSLGLIPAVLLSRSSQPSGKVAWVLAILGAPVVGGLLYLVFSAGAGGEVRPPPSGRRTAT